MKLYLAGPLFTQAEQYWLGDLKAKIEALSAKAGKEIDVVWPYELVSPEDLEKWGVNSKHKIFALCEKHLKETDVLIALLDGPLVDDGTSWEIGYFYSIRKKSQPILGIRTDFRSAGDVPGAQVNLMIDCSCDLIFSSIEDLLKRLDEILLADHF
jgi:nucleoside 2-deoxyribosyltransferase